MSTQAPSYRVIVNGVQPGEDADRVRAEAVRLFRIDESKANALINGRRVVKKDLEREKAQVYQKRLAGIGLRVELEKQVPDATAAGTGLALEPVQEPTRDTREQNDQATHTVSCPQCSLEQPASHDQCSGCGFSLASWRRDPAKAVDDSSDVSARPTEHASMMEGGDSLPGRAIAAAGGAAILGAIVWSVVAIKSGYEFGLLAWGIGAGIGIAAALTGGRGKGSAAVCAVLALVSLLGGKYMIVAGLQDEMMEMFNAVEVEQELYPIYEEYMADARVYRDVTDEASLRRFMVEREYAFASRPQDVDDEEIELFREFDEPMLLSMAANEPDFDEWRTETYDEVMNTVGSSMLFFSSFGLMDILFFALGIGTAWKLGLGEDLAAGR